MRFVSNQISAGVAHRRTSSIGKFKPYLLPVTFGRKSNVTQSKVKLALNKTGSRIGILIRRVVDRI